MRVASVLAAELYEIGIAGVSTEHFHYGCAVIRPNRAVLSLPETMETPRLQPLSDMELVR